LIQVYSLNGTFPLLLFWCSITWCVDFSINNFSSRLVQIITYKSKRLRAVSMNQFFFIQHVIIIALRQYYTSNTDESYFMDNCSTACIAYIHRHTLSFFYLVNTNARVSLQLNGKFIHSTLYCLYRRHDHLTARFSYLTDCTSGQVYVSYLKHVCLEWGKRQKLFRACIDIRWLLEWNWWFWLTHVLSYRENFISFFFLS